MSTEEVTKSEEIPEIVYEQPDPKSFTAAMIVERKEDYGRLLKDDDAFLYVVMPYIGGAAVIDKQVSFSNIPAWHKLFLPHAMDDLAVANAIVFSRRPPDDITAALLYAKKMVFVLENGEFLQARRTKV